MTKTTFHHSELLLSKRFVYFANGDSAPENYKPEERGGGVKVSEQAAEAAAEERRQSIAAAKRQRGEEKKVKKRDTKLASILEFFIHGMGRDDKLAIILARLLQRNTPVSVLLAVLSLQYVEINEVLENYLEEERDVMPEDAPAYLPNEKNLALIPYGKELSEALSVWMKRVFVHASFHPMKTIQALAHFHGVDHNIVQLCTIVIERFFKESKQAVEFERIQEFSEVFLRDLLKRLHKLSDERGLLPKPEMKTVKEYLEDEDEENDDEERY